MKEVYIVTLEKKGRRPEYFQVEKEKEFRLPQITKWAITKNYERITIKKCKIKHDYIGEK